MNRLCTSLGKVPKGLSVLYDITDLEVMFDQFNV